MNIRTRFASHSHLELELEGKETKTKTKTKNRGWSQKETQKIKKMKNRQFVQHLAMFVGFKKKWRAFPLVLWRKPV